MDSETKKIKTTQQWMREILNHEGWRAIEGIFAREILELQNAFNIIEKRDREIAIDLKARRYAADTLNSVLQEIRGLADEPVEPRQKPDWLIEQE